MNGAMPKLRRSRGAGMLNVWWDHMAALRLTMPPTLNTYASPFLAVRQDRERILGPAIVGPAIVGWAILGSVRRTRIGRQTPRVTLWLGLIVAASIIANRSLAQTNAPVGPGSPAPGLDAALPTPEQGGPASDASPSEDINEVKLGWFGPTDPAHATAGAMWLAATLATEEANQTGGYRGLPFRLVGSWSENPWGSGIADLAQQIYEGNVWGVLGAPDGASAHLVEQIVAKAQVVFLNSVSTDTTTNQANVAWIFSCAPSDDLQASVLAPAIVSQMGEGRFAVVSCTDHDSRLFASALLAALAKLKAFPSTHLALRPGCADFELQLERLGEAKPGVVALVAGPQDTARFLIALRRAGLTMPVVGGPAMGHRVFVETAGPVADGVLFPLLWSPSVAEEDRLGPRRDSRPSELGPRRDSRSSGRRDSRSGEFARRFRERYGINPDYSAAYTYDAAKLLLAAIRKAGLNRSRIRDAVRDLSPWEGVTGTITWDPTGRNRGSVRLGTIREKVSGWNGTAADSEP